jgi:putative ABC transport system substrate-binding protein
MKEVDAQHKAGHAIIATFAATHRLPTIYAAREFVDAGGLMSFAVNYPDLYRRAAT